MSPYDRTKLFVAQPYQHDILYSSPPLKYTPLGKYALESKNPDLILLKILTRTRFVTCQQMTQRSCFSAPSKSVSSNNVKNTFHELKLISCIDINSCPRHSLASTLHLSLKFCNFAKKNLSFNYFYGNFNIVIICNYIFT